MCCLFDNSRQIYSLLIQFIFCLFVLGFHSDFIRIFRECSNLEKAFDLCHIKLLLFSSDLIGIFQVTLQQLKEMQGRHGNDFPVSLKHFFHVYVFASYYRRL